MIQIPETLHTQIMQGKERLGQTLSEYVQQVLNEHFTTAAAGNRICGGLLLLTAEQNGIAIDPIAQIDKF